MSEKKKRVALTLTNPQGIEIPAKDLRSDIVEEDQLVRKVLRMAKALNEVVSKNHVNIRAAVEKHLEKVADRYGEKWQGNATLYTYDGKAQVTIENQDRTVFNSKLPIAGQKISAWLAKQQAEVHDNPKAKRILDQVANIAKLLLGLEDGRKPDKKKIYQLKKFDFSGDPEWAEAMQLLSEAEDVVGTKQYYRFRETDPETGQMANILVDFSDF